MPAKSVDEALWGFAPPLHFRRKPLVEAALKVWTAARLVRAMEQLADATLQMGGGLRFANPPYELGFTRNEEWD
jgi:hypothetical protein